MLNTRLKVARTVGTDLIALEKLIDSALVTQSRLQIAAIEGRREARLPLEAGQEGMDHLVTALASLIAARQAVHAAHRSFRSVQDTMGIPAISYGDYGDTPPPDEKRTSGALPAVAPALTVVQAA